MTRELDLIPVPARIAAGLVLVAAVAMFYAFFDQHQSVGLGTVMGLAAGSILAAFVLLSGYVYADAARRGMRPGVWTALALLVPNGVGFVLYFVLRKPIVRPCSQCGYGVGPGAAYCSRCGRRQVNLETA